MTYFDATEAELMYLRVERYKAREASELSEKYALVLLFSVFKSVSLESIDLRFHIRRKIRRN